MAERAKTRRQRRRFDPEFKEQAVRLVLDEGQSVGAVARDLDLTETAVRDWVKKAEAAETVISADKIEDVHSELRAARKRIKEMEMERAILKKATAFFAKESS